MPLNINALHLQLNDFAKTLSAKQRRVNELVDELIKLVILRGGQELNQQLQRQAARKSIAQPLEFLQNKAALPIRPKEYTLCAADGSQILPDRNYNADFFLLNISQIAFQIGTLEPPVIGAATDFYTPESLEASNDFSVDFQKVANSPEFVSALRQEKELASLLDLAVSSQKSARPILSLADGTLIAWHLKNLRDKKSQEAFLGRYATMLAEFRHHKLPIASYLSFPGGQDVIQLFSNCFAHENIPESGLLSKIYDRDFFMKFLKPGERSAVFLSPSEVLGEYENEDKIIFFYLHTGKEIARIELPKWCFQPDLALINFIHAVVYDDLQKGGGYPMMLIEAHEQAAVKPMEHEQLMRLLERKCLSEGHQLTFSAKSVSKRVAKI
ncbi:conserved hypothetical protein [Chloroherpeton thalassium ATCC 35110]|uniref:NurA domain-containing protein n=1 Tax=Chloroherpeton thalassium (strain ATCC 35110 / GB-78) TaxID=517418 RepID=B3QW93_CHLT3|nr:DNA double-strand break repair nuclease NurA [Chloroherpeton thalassium]ACF13206.1 conserved hypothetical protein [Chloroherpeton thalassium ATCC 35110]